MERVVTGLKSYHLYVALISQPLISISPISQLLSLIYLHGILGEAQHGSGL